MIDPLNPMEVITAMLVVWAALVLACILWG